jgi:SAM-dependent methyltransferase
MNALENWFCSTAFWRQITRARLLPWVFSDRPLGEHVLEIGAGPGAATREIRRCAARVTSLEYDARFNASLSDIERRRGDFVVQGDAAVLPFADNTFSSAVAILVLHHLNSHEQQNRAFAQIYRVLRPGGFFFAFEINDGWMHRSIHKDSTFVPVLPASVPARLSHAGFSRVTVDCRRGGFAIRAARARDLA